MILPMAFSADWEQIRLRKQKQINKDNIKENKSFLDYNYSVGDRVLTTDPISKEQKLERPTDGPFIVTHVTTAHLGCKKEQSTKIYPTSITFF